LNGKLNQDGRDGVLATAAVLFAILAISDFLKPLRLEGGDTGLVFFGTRLGGVPNAILGPLFGIFLLVYAAGIWRMRRYALPMGYAYAAYVVINLVMFSAKNQRPANAGQMIFGLVYIAIALAVSWGTAILLRRRKAQLS